MRKKLADKIIKTLEVVAEKKAGAACTGYMHEPEIPAKLRKKTK